MSINENPLFDGSDYQEVKINERDRHPSQIVHPPPNIPSKLSSLSKFSGVAIGIFLGLCICMLPTLYFFLFGSIDRFFNEPSIPPVKFVTLPTTTLSGANPQSRLATPLSPTVGPTQVVNSTRLKNNFATAFSLTYEGRCAEAIPHWDLAIDEKPDDGIAYFYRSFCYYIMTQEHRVRSEYEDYLQQALQDVDKAVTLGVTSALPGEPYYLRFEIYDSMQINQDLRADREYLGQIELDNLRAAILWGNSDKFSERRIPLVLYSMGRCEEGLAETRRIRESEGLSAPPSATLLYSEALGYLCLGQFEKGLHSVDQSLAIERLPDREWMRSVMLYLMGNDDEALIMLNKLIEEKPYYNGFRYYLRALIHYENGRRDLAETDIDIGSGNTWSLSGVGAYVVGRMALDDGDKEAGTEYLQYALASMAWFFSPLNTRIEQQLAGLGAQPLPEETTIAIHPTPIAGITSMAKPEVANPTAEGISLPPVFRTVSMEDGSRSMYVSKNDYPVLLFHPSEPVSIQSVQQLVLHLEPSSDSESTHFEIFLWDPSTGEWTMFKPGWDSINIEKPTQFVDSNGNIYLALRVDNQVTLRVKNIWFTLEAMGTDGSLISIDVNK